MWWGKKEKRKKTHLICSEQPGQKKRGEKRAEWIVGKVEDLKLAQRANIVLLFFSFKEVSIKRCATLQTACSFLWSMVQTQGAPLANQNVNKRPRIEEKLGHPDTHVLVYWHVHLSMHCFFFFFNSMLLQMCPHVCMCNGQTLLSFLFLLDNPAVSSHVVHVSNIKQHQLDLSVSTTLGWLSCRIVAIDTGSQMYVEYLHDILDV